MTSHLLKEEGGKTNVIILVWMKNYWMVKFKKDICMKNVKFFEA